MLHCYCRAETMRRRWGKAAVAIYDRVNAFFRHPGRRRRAAEPFEQINNSGPRYWGTHLRKWVYTSVWWERQSYRFSRRRHWNYERRNVFVYVRRWKRRKKTKWTLPIFNLAYQRETLKRINSLKDALILSLPIELRCSSLISSALESLEKIQ